MDGMMPQCHSATVSVSTLVRAQKKTTTPKYTKVAPCGLLAATVVSSRGRFGEPQSNESLSGHCNAIGIN